jgi:hypothetical protein
MQRKVEKSPLALQRFRLLGPLWLNSPDRLGRMAVLSGLFVSNIPL